MNYRSAVKPKSIFDDDSDDDLFSAIKKVSSRKENQTVTKDKVGISLFDEKSDSSTIKSDSVSNMGDNHSDGDDVPKESAPELKPKVFTFTRHSHLYHLSSILSFIRQFCKVRCETEIISISFNSIQSCGMELCLCSEIYLLRLSQFERKYPL